MKKAYFHIESIMYFKFDNGQEMMYALPGYHDLLKDIAFKHCYKDGMNCVKDTDNIDNSEFCKTCGMKTKGENKASVDFSLREKSMTLSKFNRDGEIFKALIKDGKSKTIFPNKTKKFCFYAEDGYLKDIYEVPEMDRDRVDQDCYIFTTKDGERISVAAESEDAAKFDAICWCNNNKKELVKLETVTTLIDSY